MEAAPVHRFRSLDALRGIAALLVVVQHLVLAIPDPLHDALHFSQLIKLTGAGSRFAVILFFVLSGFVLALPYFSGRSQTYGPYLVRRFFRLYPPFVFAVLVAGLLSQIFGGVVLGSSASGWANAPWSTPATLSVLTTHLMITGINWDKAIGLDSPIWSLIIEMRISLFFPLLVVWIKRFRWPGLMIGILISVVCGYLRTTSGDASLMVADDLPGALLLTLRYLCFFLVGIFAAANLAFMQKALRHTSLKRPLAIFFGLLIALGALSYMKFIPHDLVDALYASVTLFLIGILVTFPAIAARLTGRVCLWLGDISYSLYLIHLPVLLTTIYLLHGQIPFACILLIAVPLMLLAGHLMHYAIEIPSLNLGRKLTRVHGSKI